ncbi:MAG: L,D-transpeptidase family protein, partial [Candidatus Magasanikbacteria bacterium]|nr:L,D-transpeptidase family protein [Candidatus Magasanikbacteria bacterium]
MNYNPPTPFIKGENKKYKFSILFFIFIYSCIFISPVHANGLPDADKDGVPDQDEINIYHSDPNKSDTDGDGFSDWVELNKGFSPLLTGAIKLEDSDFDKDGLSDRDELRFRTDLTKADTDSDGHSDSEEILGGYDPLNSEPVLLPKRIEVNTKTQKLSYFLGDVKRGEFIVSTGKASMPTPKGNFKVDYKADKAWSGKYGLWMPFWMSLKNGYFGLHEL